MPSWEGIKGWEGMLKESIQRKDMLDNVMIEDILAANPQSAKSAYEQQAMKNRYNLMHVYMIEEILEGKNVVGEKKNLERKIGFHDDLRSCALAGVLTISNMKGQELKQYGLTDMKNQVLISTAEYPSGIYLIRLLCGYQLVDSEKISVIR